MSLKFSSFPPIAGKTYPKISDFVINNIFSELPLLTGLRGAYFTSNQNPNPLVNFADFDKPLIQIGTPTLGVKFSTTNYQNYYDTGLLSEAAMTLISADIGGQSSSTKSFAISNFSEIAQNTSGRLEGDSVASGLNSDASQHAISYAQYDAAGLTNADVNLTTNSATYDTVNPFIHGVALGQNSVYGFAYKISNKTLVSQSKTTTAVRKLTARTLLIGATYSTTEYTGNNFPSINLIYSGTLTADQILSICTWLKDNFGVTYNLWS